MRRELYTCDVCGATRTESNHWWLAFDSGGSLRFKPWDKGEAESILSDHVCGQECAHKMLSSYMEKGEQ